MTGPDAPASSAPLPLAGGDAGGAGMEVKKQQGYF